VRLQRHIGRHWSLALRGSLRLHGHSRRSSGLGLQSRGGKSGLRNELHRLSLHVHLLLRLLQLLKLLNLLHLLLQLLLHLLQVL
jgi:hypothetical protein